jgi:hypothetical protein
MRVLDPTYMRNGSINGGTLFSPRITVHIRIVTRGSVDPHARRKTTADEKIVARVQCADATIVCPNQSVEVPPDAGSVPLPRILADYLDARIVVVLPSLNYELLDAGLRSREMDGCELRKIWRAPTTCSSLMRLTGRLAENCACPPDGDP